MVHANHPNYGGRRKSRTSSNQSFCSTLCCRGPIQHGKNSKIRQCGTLLTNQSTCYRVTDDEFPELFSDDTNFPLLRKKQEVNPKSRLKSCAQADDPCVRAPGGDFTPDGEVGLDVELERALFLFSRCCDTAAVRSKSRGTTIGCTWCVKCSEF